jgi:hypothetical protein
VRITTHAGETLSHTTDVLWRRWGCRYPALAQKLLFTLADIGEVFLRIMIELSVNGQPDLVKFVENLIDGVTRCAHSLLLSSSSGVTSSGTCKPRAELIRRMWLALLGLAKCRQFHVTMKSQS